jgi:signal transduction histidine kinase
MTKALASKVAGFKLAMIIFILAIPMAVLGVAFFQQARKEIVFIGREQIGSELAQITTAQLLSQMRYLPKEGLPRVAELEAAIGIASGENYKAHLKAQYGGAITSRHEHDGSVIPGYIGDVVSRSGLILDSDESTYHLANVLGVELPAVIGDVDQMIEQLTSTDTKENSMLDVAILLGNMDESVERLEDALDRSQSASNSVRSYDQLSRTLGKIQHALSTLKANYHSAEGTLNGPVLVKQTKNVRSAIMATLVPGYELLNSKLHDRKLALQEQLWLFGSIVSVAALAAIVLAARMFSNTLKRLDEVEAAKQHSEDMRMQTEQVHHEVAALNINLAEKLAELKSAQDDLLMKGKMEQLGQLTATVAHEIRNPLGAVKTSAFLIARKINGKDTGIEPQLQRINNGIDRCDSIITQLLDFSRTKQVQTQSSRLDDWLEALLNEEAETFPASVSFECTLGLGDRDVSFDGPRLRRAVLNLINNACEAMVGKTGVAAGIGARVPHIAISTRPRGDQIEIEIADNGPGMTSEILMRVREPLFTTKNFGTGLGIPAVEQIAIQHGGSLDISSVVDVGSKFIISIPVQSTQERSAA